MALPVAPFIKVQQDRLFITLWLSGESLPQRITLRAEEDNEELSLPMRSARRRSRAWWHGAVKSLSPAASRAAATALSCCGPTISAGLRQGPPFPAGQAGTVDLPDAGPQWVADQVLSDFPRFCPQRARDAEQDAVYYHHAAGREIVRKAWDEPLTGEAGGSTFYGGDLDGISEKLPYLKQLGVTALYLNPVFAAPSVHKYDTEDYRRVDPQFGGDAALLRCATTPSGRGCA
jgi:alpha-glucosidase